MYHRARSAAIVGRLPSRSRSEFLTRTASGTRPQTDSFAGGAALSGTPPVHPEHAVMANVGSTGVTGSQSSPLIAEALPQPLLSTPSGHTAEVVCFPGTYFTLPSRGFLVQPLFRACLLHC